MHRQPFNATPQLNCNSKFLAFQIALKIEPQLTKQNKTKQKQKIITRTNKKSDLKK